MKFNPTVVYFDISYIKILFFLFFHTVFGCYPELKIFGITFYGTLGTYRVRLGLGSLTYPYMSHTIESDPKKILSIERNLFQKIRV